MSAQAASSRTKGATERPSTTPKAAATANFDYGLIAIVATLLAIGLVEVYSASFMVGGSNYFVKQLLWVVLGVGVLIAMATIPYHLWQRLAVPIMAVTLLLLLAVLVFGTEKYGATRTLLGGQVQPSEIAKLSLVIYVAAWVASKKKSLREVRGGLIPFAIVMGIVCGLVVLERSFSVTIILLITGVTIFFVGGGEGKQLLLIGVIALVVLVLLIYKFHYGVGRIQDWWQTLIDPDNAPYQVAQVHAMIRKGGGIATRPENWLQKGNVPLLWSDYLFANLAADLKLPGAVAVVALIAALGYRGLSIALNAPDQFGALMAIGVTTWLLLQSAIHMGTSVALIPATGIPLPFMSYGGSAMIASMAAVGLLLNISRVSSNKKLVYATFTIRGRNRGTRVPDPVSRGGAPAERRTTKDQRPGNTGGWRPKSGRKTVDDGQRSYGDWRTRVSQPRRRRKSVTGRGTGR